ncbi:MAG TPA: type VI secretion system baseplate subunit TssK [Acidobacteriaceae bacterium]|nr:type VI secretion system baseplate subunit TssK [Acidobacteriaceae bacterium]
MKFLSRVVWSEGMHLSPQHFQMQSRYFEDSLWFLSGSLRNNPWGLLSLALDNDAVRNGLAVLRYASGVFPDGLVFEIPDSDPPPPQLSLKDLFTPTDSEIMLHLAVPGRRGQGFDTDLNGGFDSRYATFERVLRDETISEDEYPVTLGRKNLILCSTAQLQPDHISFPIARILRDGKGGFVADPAFLPPLLRIGVIEDLLHRIKHLADLIEEKIIVTRSGQKKVGQFEAGTSALDVANYWFLHALCSVTPALRNQLASRNGHPEELYSILAEVSGSLCTFSLDSNPATIPAYDHLNLNRVFSELEDHIQRHLEIVVPSNTVTLDFRRSEQNVHFAQVLDERCFRRSRWIFGIRSDISESATMRLTPNLVKICSAEGVVKLVQRALPGLELVHLPVPPSALAAQADMHYFTIAMSGPCWQHILVTKNVGVFLPSELGNAIFEVTIIVEANA